jgi:hypothetical protein
MPHDLVIDGNHFCDCDGFVTEFNRACLAAIGGLTWDGDFHRFGEFVEMASETAGGILTVRWLNSRKSCRDLGHEQTVRYCLRQMERIPVPPSSPGFAIAYRWYEDWLHRARRGQGRTVFEWLVWQIRGDGEPGAEEDDFAILLLE